MIAYLVIDHHIGSGETSVSSEDYRLDHVSWFIRSQVRELIRFACLELVRNLQLGLFSRTPLSSQEKKPAEENGMRGSRWIVPQDINGDLYHVYVQRELDRWCVLVVAGGSGGSGGSDESRPKWSGVVFKHMKPGANLQLLQQACDADPLARVQNLVDETLEITRQNIEAIIDRGDRLDDLVRKTTELSSSTKTFYQASKKLNRCCVML